MIGLGWELPWYVRWPLRVAFALDDAISALDDAISWIRSRKRSGG